MDYPESYASTSDLEAGWRSLTDDEYERADTLLLRASLLVKRRFPTLDARIAAGTVFEEEAIAVVCGMVKRAMVVAGGEGVLQNEETVGPFSGRQVYANPMGNLYLSKDEIAALTDPAHRRRAFSVDLAPMPATGGDYFGD